ncbi:hypothetical protein [Blastococcus tunisiensis]|uniref:Uncharacterized protein n=1 Tax=Blastococcus tunisiensis TaxID=1798228 RepID=A0A1I2HPH5_9ACTN|nr:hypothetical protein [Blastococcus sp. DSM 46838]SFF32255.1 hypothetical protein SAMN05216574_111135 [Blastococcus sp. DSM 46838]
MLESHSTSADSASVIAARQLAQEAQRRRTLSELHRRSRRPLYVPPLPATRKQREDAGE